MLTAALWLAACGGDGSEGSTEPTTTAPASTTSSSQEQSPSSEVAGKAAPQEEGKLQMSKAEIAKLPKLTIPRQDGSLPTRVEVIDRRVGDGAAITLDDAAIVNFLSAPYLQAEKKSFSGISGTVTMGLDEALSGWKIGLPGMRVGGRRELILPPRFAHRNWTPNPGSRSYDTTIYVIDLLGIERGGADQSP